MARFLRLLDTSDGNTVLEIGTGTGYNAALLCERLVSANVTSIDIDAELVEAARAALASCGYAPTLAVQDGFHGYPARAPYDRIIATCSVPRIPRPWLDQLMPGGVIVAPMASGLLVGLHRQPDGSLVGRGDPTGAGFMDLRSSAWPEQEFAPFAEGDVETRPLTRPGALDPGSAAGLYAELQIRDLALAGDAGERMLGGRADGSWARVVPDEEGGHIVVQAGPRRLWDQWETALDEWTMLGSPGWERFGLTVRPAGSQFVWLDSPDSGHSREL
jgi:protein-L-isoaspartate O-methyltransferase